MKKLTLTKELFVYIAGPPNDQYHATGTNLDECANLDITRTVGRYRLVETLEVTAKTVIQSKRKAK